MRTKTVFEVFTKEKALQALSAKRFSLYTLSRHVKCTEYNADKLRRYFIQLGLLKRNTDDHNRYGLVVDAEKATAIVADAWDNQRYIESGDSPKERIIANYRRMLPIAKANAVIWN